MECHRDIEKWLCNLLYIIKYMIDELILPLPELNLLLITYLDPWDNYKNINQINKYNNEIIKNNKFYKELKKLYCEIDEIDRIDEITKRWQIFPKYNQFYLAKAC